MLIVRGAFAPRILQAWEIEHGGVGLGNLEGGQVGLVLGVQGPASLFLPRSKQDSLGAFRPGPTEPRQPWLRLKVTCGLGPQSDPMVRQILLARPLRA
jgi:hypothetical protein